jgi:hypothetical protein
MGDNKEKGLDAAHAAIQAARLVEQASQSQKEAIEIRGD